MLDTQFSVRVYGAILKEQQQGIINNDFSSFCCFSHLHAATFIHDLVTKIDKWDSSAYNNVTSDCKKNKIEIYPTISICIC